MQEKEKVKNYFNWNKVLKISILCTSLVFLVLNIMAIFHAHHFTHFLSGKELTETLNENSSSAKKIKSILLGVPVRKPINDSVDLDFVDVDTITKELNLEIWRLDMEPSKGVVALFHGYKASKSSLWKEAQAFYRMGFTVVLVDFRSAGNSDGNQCTLGYFEANDVEATYQYCLKEYPDQKIFLYGSSMGAAAVMRAVAKLAINPSGILIQSPFYTMLNAVKTRFQLMGIPSFPSAHLITFWGGWINDFDAFSHNPIDYAPHINCPTLLIHGMLDTRVSYESAKSIYKALPQKKEFGIFSKSGHESILNKEEPNWIYLVTNFMETHRH